MNPNIITYIVTLVAGVLFIVYRGESRILDTLTVIAAVIFIVPGLINFILGIRNSRKEKNWTTTFGLMLVSAGAVALGALMLIFPDFFRNYVAFTLGILLVLCGAYQLVWVLKGTGRPKERWFVVVPVLMFAAGIVMMILRADGFTSGLWITTGCVLLAYSLNGFLAMKMLSGRAAGKSGSGTVIVK